MMKTYVLVMMLLAAVTLIACSTGPEDTPMPSAPTPEEADEPMLPDAPTPPGTQEETATEEEARAPSEAGGSDQLERVTCDASTKTITFSIENRGERNWNLDLQAPIIGGDEVNVRVFVNGYEANRHSPQRHPDTREVMFGPETPFSANCGGEPVLGPGQQVECTLTPVPLNRGTGSVDQRGVNIIRLDSPSTDRTIEFTC